MPHHLSPQKKSGIIDCFLSICSGILQNYGPYLNFSTQALEIIFVNVSFYSVYWFCASVMWHICLDLYLYRLKCSNVKYM